MVKTIPVAALLVWLAAPAAMAQPAAGAAPRAVEASRIFPYLDKYWSLPPAERSRFTPTYYLRQDGHAARDVSLSLARGGTREPLPVAGDGRVERLPSAGDVAAKLPVMVDAPKGAKLSSGMELEATLRPATELPAGELVAAIDQSNAAIHRFAGLLGFAAPHMSRVVFRGPASGVAILADGRTVPLANSAAGLAFDPALVKGARTIRLASAPEHIFLRPAAKK